MKCGARDVLEPLVEKRRLGELYEAIMDACCIAWNKLIDTPARIRSIATREWAKTVSS